MARRIQRKRTKGWRMPEGAVYVGRPSRWGNPHRVGSFVSCDCLQDQAYDEQFTPERAIEAFRHWSAKWAGPYYDLATLRGHDLACWCPLGQPCHADVLLELANNLANSRTSGLTVSDIPCENVGGDGGI